MNPQWEDARQEHPGVREENLRAPRAEFAAHCPIPQATLMSAFTQSATSWDTAESLLVTHDKKALRQRRRECGMALPARCAAAPGKPSPVTGARSLNSRGNLTNKRTEAERGATPRWM